jgi:hypothetical protein
MVGGRIIEIRPMRIMAGTYPGKLTDVVRLWVRNEPDDECAVYAEPANCMPKLGDEIWWQAGRIFFDKDRRSLRKVGYSFDPRPHAR